MTNEEFLQKAPFLKVREGGKDSIMAFDCAPSDLLKAVDVAKSCGFDMLSDIASLDMGEDEKPRFSCVYHFYSTTNKEYLRLVCACESEESPKLPSLSSYFGNANWFEREAFDMMGIVFENHPDLRRILMWDSYPYNPLRKDFPLAGKDAPIPEIYEDVSGDAPLKVVPAPMEGGPFHSNAGAKTSAEKEPRSHQQI